MGKIIFIILLFIHCKKCAPTALTGIAYLPSVVDVNLPFIYIVCMNNINDASHLINTSHYIYTIILLISVSLSVLLIWGLYRPSSEPIALRNVLKCPTRHTLHIIRFWHFSSLLSLQKPQKTQFYASSRLAGRRRYPFCE